MAFRDLDDFPAVKPLVLPIRGKEYSFPGDISARTWLKVQALAPQINAAIKSGMEGEDYDVDAEVLSDMDQNELMEELCGDTLKEMLADGLMGAHLKAVLATLIAFHLSGNRMIAEAVWNNQGEAPAPNRASRRKTTATPSARSRGSHAGLTDLKTKRVAKADPGETSSDAGT